MDLKKLIEEVMDALAENGSDTYLQFKLMIKADAAERGGKEVILLWDKLFAEADSKRRHAARSDSGTVFSRNIF